MIDKIGIEKVCRHNILIRVFFIYSLIMIAIHAFSPSTNLPQAENGSIFLNKHMIFYNEAIPLNGQWAFYWGKLLDETNINKKSSDTYVEVPGVWNSIVLNENKLPGQGYATYKLHVKTDLDKDEILGLKTSALSSAYKIYIDDKLVASNGIVSSNADNEVGEYKPQLIFFNIPDDEFDIIVQISNYHHSEGGFWNRIFIGTAKNITEYYNQNVNFEFLTIGSMLFMTIYNLAIYARKKDMISYLLFGLFCIAALFLIDFLTEMVLVSRLNLNLDFLIFIWYITATLIILLFLLYFRYVIDSKALALLSKAYMVVVSIYGLLFCLTKPVFYTRFAGLYNFIDAIFVLIGVVIIVNERINLGDRIELHIISILLLLESYINGALNYNNNGINYCSVGLMIFCIIQAILLAGHEAKNEDDRRTAELLFLRAQINPHFLYNTLNVFISLSRVNLDHSIELLHNLIDYLRVSFDLKDFSQFVSLEQELKLVKTYVEIEKVRFYDRFEVVFDIEADCSIKVPVLIIQPLVENSIKHGIMKKKGRGIIRIDIRQEDNRIFFLIGDNGAGMSRQRLKEVMTDPEKKRVGIANINKRLKQLYQTEMEIRSKPDHGTEVSFVLPIAQNAESHCLTGRCRNSTINFLLQVYGERGKKMAQKLKRQLLRHPGSIPSWLKELIRRKFY